MADLSLLLDIVLKTSSQTIKKEFVVCGILNQLQQAIGRNFSREYRCERALTPSRGWMPFLAKRMREDISVKGLLGWAPYLHTFNPYTDPRRLPP